MIAFLGMYDMPPLRAANDAFWTAIRAELGYGPEHLTRTDDPWPVWQSPDLLFAQTCGWKFIYLVWQVTFREGDEVVGENDGQ